MESVDVGRWQQWRALDPESRWRFALGVFIPVCFLACVVVSALTIGSAWPRWDAIVPFALGVVGAFVWFRLARRAGRGPGVVPARPGWYIRRVTGARVGAYAGLLALFAMGDGVSHDLPEWRAFAAADLTVQQVGVVETGEVDTIGRRTMTTYEFDLTARVPIGDRDEIVTERVQLYTDPRDVAGAPQVWAIFDPTQPDLGMFFTDRPEQFDFLQQRISGGPTVIVPVVLIVSWWFFGWSENRRSLTDRAGPRPIAGRRRRWVVVNGLLITAATLGFLFAYLPGGGQEPVGFGNELWNGKTASFVLGWLVMAPFVIALNVRLLRQVRDLKSVF